jgi:hypothetical protein
MIYIAEKKNMNCYILSNFSIPIHVQFCTIFGAGAASCYGSGSDQMMLLLAALAPQHCFEVKKSKENNKKKFFDAKKSKWKSKIVF